MRTDTRRVLLTPASDDHHLSEIPAPVLERRQEAAMAVRATIDEVGVHARLGVDIRCEGAPPVRTAAAVEQLVPPATVGGEGWRAC